MTSWRPVSIKQLAAASTFAVMVVLVVIFRWELFAAFHTAMGWDRIPATASSSDSTHP